MNESHEMQLFLSLAKGIIDDEKDPLGEYFQKDVIDWGRFKGIVVFHELFPFFLQEVER